MAKVVLSLGSNDGDRFKWMAEMESKISQKMRILNSSPLYETEPVGVDGSHSYYLNRVILVEYQKGPFELLVLLQTIEKECERTGKGELLPRTADIDILLFEGEVITTETLTIPHHALLERRFSVEGVQAVVPEWILPSGIRVGDITLSEELLLQEIEVIE